jgi:hypothetical protein
MVFWVIFPENFEALDMKVFAGLRLAGVMVSVLAESLLNRKF